MKKSSFPIGKDDMSLKTKDALNTYSSRSRRGRKKSKYFSLFIGIFFCLFIAIIITILMLRLLNYNKNNVYVTTNPNEMEKNLYIDFSSIGIKEPYDLKGKTARNAIDEVLDLSNFSIQIQNKNPDIDSYEYPNLSYDSVTLEPKHLNEDGSEQDLSQYENSTDEIIFENPFKNLIYIPEKEKFILPNILDAKIESFIGDIYKDNIGKSASIFKKSISDNNDENFKCDYTFSFVDSDGIIQKIVEDLALVWNTKSTRGEIASYDNKRNEFIFGGDKKGYEIKQNELKETIINVLNSGNLNQNIDAPYNVILPEGEIIKNKYRIASSFTTETTNNEIRNKNIDLACHSINGKILQPGEEFSFNKIVGERTEKKGYGAAPAYNEGEVVEEIGGGVCQVSSTLYNAVFCAGLKSTYRTSHTFEPSYVAPGLDATVSWNGPDYRFINITNYPLGIKANYQDKKCKVEIFCVPVFENGTTVSISSTKLQDFEIPAPVLVSDDKAETKGTKGSEWQVFKVVKQNGKVVEKIHDHYSKYKGHSPQVHQDKYDIYISQSESSSIEESIKESIRIEKGETLPETIVKKNEVNSTTTKKNTKAPTTQAITEAQSSLAQGGYFSPFNPN
ncbi:MAG: VanW family protein [Eubacteriales bacterium]|nr:VanW family protein [Eubacteriales bacterium]